MLVSRVRPYSKIARGSGLSLQERPHFLHRSNLDSYHFQNDLPRLPIPTLDNSLKRYLASVDAQGGSKVSEEDIRRTHQLAVDEKPQLEELHRLLLKSDSENQHTSFLNGPWTDMYLKDRTPLPFNVTPYIGIVRDEKEHMNHPTLRATNVLLSTVRFHNTLENNMIDPEMYPLAKRGPQKQIFNSVKKLLEYTPGGIKFKPPVGGFTVAVGVRSMIAGLGLQVAALDMKQYANLTASTRIPQKGKDYLKKTKNSKHCVVICRGRFYKIQTLDSDNKILSYDAIYNAIEAIKSHAKSLPYNQDDSIAYYSSTNRDDWAEARQHLVSLSKENSNNLDIIDEAIFPLILEDEVTTVMKKDPANVKEATDKFLGGNGASRWWDKSLSWIVSDGGDAFITFEHAWGDGVAVMRLMKEIYEETTTAPCLRKIPEATEPAPFEELKFSLDGKAREMLLKAKNRYEEDQKEINVGAFVTEVGKDFFKEKKLSPDAILQLSMQAGYQKVVGETCPVYESVSTAAFLHGRTETMRSCTVESVKAAKMIAKGDYKPEELRQAVNASAKRHRKLTMEAQVGQGFDRHLYGMKHHATLNGIELPEILSDKVHQHMMHFNMSTSTLDMPFAGAGGFGCVVPDGFGLGYMCQPDVSAFAVTSRKSTQLADAAEVAQAAGESLSQISKAFS